MLRGRNAMSNRQLQDDDLIGAVKLQSEWRFFTGFFAEWILDYSAFDPDFNFSPEKHLFRNGLLRVDETNADKFCEAMQPYELSENQLQQIIEADDTQQTPLMFVVDFDNLTFVSSYFDYPIENYVPEGWKAYFGNTYEYVPEKLRALWEL
jgi:hypothetical protein